MLDNLNFGVSRLFGKVNTITFRAEISGKMLSRNFQNAFKKAGIPCNLDDNSDAVSVFNPRLSFPAGDLTEEQCKNIGIALRGLYGESFKERMDENIIAGKSIGTEESQINRILEHG